MARTLPWLNSGTTSTHQPARPRPTKRQRTLDPNSDADNNANTRAIVNPRKQAARTAERTPSTSPPPQPPTEDFMRPGLSADDIYIMVEDEFLAVAQTFTKHLHHAEYIRLRKAAKERNASTINNISRPVDSSTTMREETRRKKEAEARGVKMKAAIESIKGPKRANGPADESDVSDFEEDRQDDPWQGTQLQRFMTKSPKKTLPGLTGLQGVTSHTRAAAGYSKPEKRALQPTRLFESTCANKAGASKPITIAQAASDSASSETDDDDDLDAPSRIPSRPPPRIPPRHPSTTTTAAKPHPKPTSKDLPRQVTKLQSPPPAPAKASPAPGPSTLSSSSSKPSAKPVPPSPTINHSAAAPAPTTIDPRPSVSEVRQRLRARREREENERNRSKGMGGVDEIPIFLA